MVIHPTAKKKDSIKQNKQQNKKFTQQVYRVNRNT